MWRSAGISREEQVLKAALEQVEMWQQELAKLSICQFLNYLSPQQSNQFDDSSASSFTNSSTYTFSDSQAESYLRKAIEVMNLLDVSYLILKSALFRTESRGGHYRSDYPQTQIQWQVHTIVEGDRNAFDAALADSAKQLLASYADANQPLQLCPSGGDPRLPITLPAGAVTLLELFWRRSQQEKVCNSLLKMMN
jgi:hypothetical protein